MDCKSVLVVEDDEAIRDTLQELLSWEGYHVLVATNGKEALHLLEEKAKHPCLVLLDLFMPVMNGYEFMRAIKNEKTDILASIPVVLVTAAGEAANEAKKMASGFVKKPIDLDSLLAVVKKHCG